MEEEEELVERQQMQKKRRTEQLLTSGEVMSILRSRGIMLIFENWEENNFYKGEISFRLGNYCNPGVLCDPAKVHW